MADMTAWEAFVVCHNTMRTQQGLSAKAYRRKIGDTFRKKNIPAVLRADTRRKLMLDYHAGKHKRRTTTKRSR